MRTRTILAAAAAPAALAAILLGTAGQATPAHAAALTASVGTAGPGNGQAGHITGKNALVYDDGVFGWVKVNETQHPNFDTISATFVTDQSGKTSRTDPGMAGQTGSVPWDSDFAATYANPNGTGTPGSIHPGQGTMTYTVNADGSGYTGQATYPAS
jgi:hypothetical protein